MHVDLHRRKLAKRVVKECGKCGRADGWSDSDIENTTPAEHRAFGMLAHVSKRELNAHELGLNVAAERGQTAVLAVAIDQRTAQVFLEALDCPRETGLRNPASTRGFGEIQCFGQIEKVPDLIDVHGLVSLGLG